MGPKATFGLTTSNSCTLTIEVAAPKASARTLWSGWWWRYLLMDGVAAALAWTTLFLFRKTVIEPRRFGMDIDTTPDKNFWLAVVLVPLFWWKQLVPPLASSSDDPAYESGQLWALKWASVLAL